MTYKGQPGITCKVLWANTAAGLEFEIAKETSRLEVVDIQFSFSMTKIEDKYTALVLYKIEDDQPLKKIAKKK